MQGGDKVALWRTQSVGGGGGLVESLGMVEDDNKGDEER